MSINAQDLLETTMTNFIEAVKNEDLPKTKQIITDSQHQQTQTPEMSIKKNINFQKPDDGMTALHYAAMAATDDFVTLLLVNGADPTISAKDGRTPAHEAAASGKLTNIVAILNNNNSLAYVADDDGDVPLHLASFHGRKDVVAYLTKIMTDVNQKDKRGCTALYEAALNAQPECMELLIPKSNIFIRNKNNSTVLQAASSEEDNYTEARKKCIEILLDNYAGICGDVNSNGIKYVDFTNKILIGLKISGTPIIDCVDFYTENYCKNTTLKDAIYTKEQLAAAIKSKRISKDKLSEMKQACDQQIVSIENIPGYKENDEFCEDLEQLRELSSFFEQLATQPPSLIESIVKLFVFGKSKPVVTPIAVEQASDVDAAAKNKPPSPNGTSA